MEGVAPGDRGTVPQGSAYSLWQLVEHLRLAQHDILDFCVNPNYEEMDWPDDYWPAEPEPPSDAAWEESLAGYREDRDRVIALAKDTSLDIHQQIAHGTGRRTFGRSSSSPTTTPTTSGRSSSCGACSGAGPPPSGPDHRELPWPPEERRNDEGTYATGRSRGPVCLVAVAICVLCVAAAPAAVGIYKATLQEPGQHIRDPTNEMRRILREGTATVLDARPHAEYALSHIPGAKNVAAKPGVEKSMYISDVAEVTRLVHEDKKTPLVLFCNGPFCGKSKRLAEELHKAGYTSVRRYHSASPCGERSVASAPWTSTDFVPSSSGIAPRSSSTPGRREEFAAGSLPGARSIPRSLVLDEKDTGEVKRAKDDGRLPLEITTLGSS